MIHPTRPLGRFGASAQIPLWPERDGAQLEAGYTNAVAPTAKTEIDLQIGRSPYTEKRSAFRRLALAGQISAAKTRASRQLIGYPDIIRLAFGYRRKALRFSDLRRDPTQAPMPSP